MLLQGNRADIAGEISKVIGRVAPQIAFFAIMVIRLIFLVVGKTFLMGVCSLDRILESSMRKRNGLGLADHAGNLGHIRPARVCRRCKRRRAVNRVNASLVYECRCASFIIYPGSPNVVHYVPKVKAFVIK